MEKKPKKTPEQNGDTYSTGEFPGYPHYPSGEDITKSANNTGKESLNEENISAPDHYNVPGQQLKDTKVANEKQDATNTNDTDDDVNIVMGTEADVTDEDLALLDMTDAPDDINLRRAGLDNEDEDGEALNEKDINEDVSGKDLDVPGSENDDQDEAIGEEDEENNYYSLGGDNHEAQEEDNGG